MTAEKNPYFYGKILLFGEYLVISGSNALTLPFRNVKARLVFPGGEDQLGIMSHRQSNRELSSFLDYLVQLDNKWPEGTGLDLDRFSMDLKKGIYLASNIPLGYGVGSSGAIVASVYDRYLKQQSDPLRIEERSIPALKDKFSKFESFFHGTSSGLDPLAIFMDSPLLIEGSGRISRVVLEKVPRGIHLYLLDAAETGNTGPLVRKYNQWMKDATYSEKIKTNMIPLNESMIHDFLVAGSTDFLDHIWHYSEYQLELFRDMIPGKIIPVWKHGLDSGDYFLKLCGSGGGGYFLAFSHLPALPMQVTNQFRIEKFDI